MEQNTDQAKQAADGNNSGRKAEDSVKWRHDLNNHFAGIRMQVLLARMKLKKKDVEMMEILRGIEAECEQVAGLLEQSRGNEKSLISVAGTDAELPVRPRPERGLVLLMDDNESLQVALAKILNEIGFEVVKASGGETCVEIYKEFCQQARHVDVVVLDVKVPGGVGGVETLERLKQINPGVRAIVCSGYAGSEVMSNFQQYGFSGALNKPFRIHELVDLLDRLIAGQN